MWNGLNMLGSRVPVNDELLAAAYPAEHHVQQARGNGRAHVVMSMMTSPCRVATLAAVPGLGISPGMDGAHHHACVPGLGPAPMPPTMHDRARSFSQAGSWRVPSRLRRSVSRCPTPLRIARWGHAWAGPMLAHHVGAVTLSGDREE